MPIAGPRSRFLGVERAARRRIRCGEYANPARRCVFVEIAVARLVVQIDLCAGSSIGRIEAQPAVEAAQVAAEALDVVVGALSLHVDPSCARAGDVAVECCRVLRFHEQFAHDMDVV